MSATTIDYGSSLSSSPSVSDVSDLLAPRLLHKAPTTETAPRHATIPTPPQSNWACLIITQMPSAGTGPAGKLLFKPQTAAQ
ncbi:hypothetical protein VTK56DRAFT_1408 [Thermocarpiscus australiensis]